ncbi:hypothetical protein NDU88_000622 [Pleurodeles waltl]|uniref:Class II aldolase/adducin N-terminal domain-containing protein n=1 Tax=Pleurodeles waltl TaxID=8319 RepID=A0AAV7S8M4_PLEWA|nr:hypothetical protein NDU88_000622 [Pleurodeles waltl]
MGPSSDLMSADTFHALAKALQLNKARMKVFTYGQSQSLPMLGCFKSSVSHESVSVDTTVYLAVKGHGMLVSGHTAEALDLIYFAFGVQVEELSNILARFDEVFQGIFKTKQSTTAQRSDDSTRDSAA